MVPRFRIIIVAIVACFAHSVASASSDPVFIDYRTVGPENRFYAVVRRLGGRRHETPSGPVEIILAERGTGTSPVQNAQGETVVKEDDDSILGEVYIVNSTVGIRDSDTILGRIQSHKAPRKLLICPDTRTFVLVDEHGMNHNVQNGGPALQSYSFSGDKLFSKDLPSLFGTGETARFERTTAGIHWFRAAWIDHGDSAIVLVACQQYSVLGHLRGLPSERAVRVVNLQTGNVSPAGQAVIIRALKSEERSTLRVAIELAGDLKLALAVEPLQSLSRSTDSTIRSLAIDSLQKIEMR